jgi:hypothetical protein
MKPILLTFALLAAIISYAQTNYALSLNGTTQFVSIGTPLSNNTSYTKEAWVYVTTTSGSRNIVSSSLAPFWISAGQLSAGHGGNYWQVVDPSTITTNKWTHVAVTYDAATTTMKLYRDGLLVNTNTGVASNYTSENTYIGSHAGAGSYLQGTVDEVRLWNVARTQAQLKQNLLNPPANNASNLVAYYKLNDGSGSSATNSTGGANGTLQNSPSWVTSPTQFSGNALNFDGTDDVVTIADHSSLDITSAITMEAWVYATKSTGIQNVISKSSNGTNNGYIFPRTDDGWANAVIYFHIAGGWRTLSAAYPGLNTWHHLAATYDGANIRLFINGVESASVAQTGSLTTNGNALAIGNQPGYSEYFGGSVDQIRIWNVARTQAQIASNMNVDLDPATQTGLVSNYTFNQGIAAGTNTGMTTVVDMKSENNGTLSNFTLTGSTSNFGVQNAILPLRWLGFTAQQEGNSVQLNWSTSSELNTKDFTMQHTVNGIDWKDFGKVNAAGNSDAVQRYSHVHTTPAGGINYYRILQTDIDGRNSYSEVRTVTLNDNNNSFVVLRNPVENHEIRIRIYEVDFISLFNSDGKLLVRKKVVPGVTILKADKKGIYFLKGETSVRKILVN